MKMISLNKDKFDEYVNDKELKNYCQTSNYGLIMSEQGFDYEFLGYTTNDNEILAAGMVLIKKINNKYMYAYCPKGYILDYNDPELLKKFIHNVIKYYKKRKIIFLKINPEIIIANIEINNDFKEILNENVNILNSLKSLGFKRRKEIKPNQLLEKKFTAIVNLETYSNNTISKTVLDRINSYDNNGLTVEIADANKIEYFYDLIQNTNKTINYYRNLVKTFKKTDMAEIFLIKIDYEKLLISAKNKLEKDIEINDNLNITLQENNSPEILQKKMESDNALENSKQDVIKATDGLKNKKETYISGAIIIKYEDELTIFESAYNTEYQNLDPLTFLYKKIIDKYKDDFSILDFNGISEVNNDDTIKYFNEKKMQFKPEIIEYIGELDLIIDKWKFNIIEKSNLLGVEFSSGNIKKES